MTTELITFTNSSLKEREHFDAKKKPEFYYCVMLNDYVVRGFVVLMT